MNYKLNARVVREVPPPLPPIDALCGKYITLSPLRAADFDDFIALYNVSHRDSRQRAVWRYLPYGAFPTAADMMDFYRRAEANRDTQFYLVRHLDGEQAGGVVSYLRMEPPSYSIEIGHIWHAADYQRGRANTEAAFLLIENAFILGYRRVEWKCNALNMSSRRAALRLGFAFEGVFRQCTVSKGKNRDTAWFAIVNDDWWEMRENFCEWLAAPAGSMSLAEKNLPWVEWSLPAHKFWAAR